MNELSVPHIPQAVADLAANWFTPVTLSVQWGELDAFQHVNNTVYLRWIESARIRLFQATGMMSGSVPDGCGPILASVNARYRLPVTYPDTITALNRIGEIRSHDFFIESCVISHAHAAVAFEASVRIVWFDYDSGGKAEIPEALRQAMGAYQHR